MHLQVISTARTCNLILIVLDCLKPISHKRLIEHELEGFGIRLNKQPPAITFRRKEKGGIASPPPPPTRAWTWTVRGCAMRPGNPQPL